MEILAKINFVVGRMVLASPVSRFIPDRVVPAVDGDPVDLWVYAVLPKEGWVPRSPGDFVRAEHPGSAIRYRDQIYEVMRVEERSRERTRFVIACGRGIRNAPFVTWLNTR